MIYGTRLFNRIWFTIWVMQIQTYNSKCMMSTCDFKSRSDVEDTLPIQRIYMLAQNVGCQVLGYVSFVCVFVWKINAKLFWIPFNSICIYVNQKLTSLWQNLKFHYKMFQDEEINENIVTKNQKRNFTLRYFIFIQVLSPWLLSLHQVISRYTFCVFHCFCWSKLLNSVLLTAASFSLSFYLFPPLSLSGTFIFLPL